LKKNFSLELSFFGVQRFIFWSPTLQLWKIGVQRFSFGKLEFKASALENWSPTLQLWAFFGINVVFWWAKKLVQRPTSLNLLENRNMETIQIPVTSELAQQLRFYQDELPRLLELGLRLIKTENLKQIQTETAYLTSLSLQEKTINVLRRAGANAHQAKDIAQYLAKPAVKNWQPIHASGQSASDMIIEERKSRVWNPI
jgi:hypothetical protein